MFTVGTHEVSTEPVVGSVMENSAAAQSGMETGDRIVTISGVPIREWKDISKAVNDHCRDVLSVVVNRNGEDVDLTMVPTYDTQSKRALIGVVPVVTRKQHGFFESSYMAVERTGQICYAMVAGMYGMIRGTEKADRRSSGCSTAGRAGSVCRICQSAHVYGILSINLGILNLLPIPLLDGAISSC